MKEKIPGILGGMGPEATIDLAKKILNLTPIKKEQDHLRIIIDNNPKIENRTRAILSGNTSLLVRQLCETAENLRGAGADFIVIPCNTAHYFLEEIRKAVNIEVLDMIRETAHFIKRKLPGVEKAGLLATTATVKTGLYRQALEEQGIEILIPSGADQERVMRAITGVKEKAGHEKARRGLSEIAGKLVRDGASAVIAGCTEVPLALTDRDVSAPLVDPAMVLARKTVLKARGGENGA